MILGDLLVTALAIAIEPLPLLTFVLTLASKKGVRAGWAYLAGWSLSLIVVVGAAVWATGAKGLKPTSSPSAASYAIDIVLGFALIALGLFHNHRHRGRPTTPPKLLARVESMGFVWAALLGIFMQPWVLVAAGAVAILRADMGKAISVVAVVLFCVLGSSVLLTLQLFAVLSPERATRRLAMLRAWLETHRTAVITALALLLGAYLLVEGVYGLL